LIGEAIELLSEPPPVDARSTRERTPDRFRGDEPAFPERRELSDGNTISRHDEGFSLVERAHDRTAVVAELALGDLSGHGAL